MAIVKMKKLKLMAIASQKEELLRELMLLGCVQIAEPSAGAEGGESPELERYGGADVAKRRSEQTALVNSINTLKKYAPDKGGLLSPLPEVPVAKLLDEAELAKDMGVAQKITELDDRIRRLTAEEGRVHSEIEALTPWEGLDLALDCPGTETSAVIFATLPAAMDVSEAEAALADAAERAQLFPVSRDKRMAYFVLVCYREDLEAAQAALRGFAFAAVSMGETHGTAAGNISRLEKRLSAIAAEKEQAAAEIAAQAPSRQQLKLRADTLSTKVAMAEAEDKLLCTDTVVCLEGWVPAEAEAGLVKLLANYDCAWETTEPETEDYPAVPVKLKNNVLTRPLNMVTEMYSLPAYDGVDPNPLMAPFFILFYGIMMADMGYGLLMMLAGVIVLKMKKPKAGMKTFFELLFVCGISTFIWGAITGGFFGDAPLQVARILNPNTTWQGLPALFSPLNDTVMILIGAMALGVVHIVTGMAISFVEKIKAGEVKDAIFEEVTWWIVFAGIACFALGAGWYVLALGGVMVVAGPVITGVGFGKITGIFGTLYNHITGFFGDILSYSRLMALMLAGSVIAQVFNTIGAIPGNIVVFLIVSILGNALNFALNLLGCYVHDLRLQCLEFFGKFYKDGGKPFRPLSVDTKYVNVANAND